ncbi:MAG: TMEM165/GDT1 family protein [Nanoarchaeota archaeon]|nr:TMEM165/GDT1 family protein [Nanoarchaeota archaeon]
MIQDFIIPFVAVGLAELGDKTQLAVLCLASKTKNYLQLILGVMLAFILTDGLAIVLGDYLASLIPLSYIRMISGSVFILFGIITLLRNNREGAKCELKNPFLSGFGIVFVAELGDKTQIASALFATRFNPVLVFFGVIAALFILSMIAVFLGRYVYGRVDKKKVSMIAGTLFILIGAYCLFF